MRREVEVEGDAIVGEDFWFAESSGGFAVQAGKKGLSGWGVVVDGKQSFGSEDESSNSAIGIKC